MLHNLLGLILLVSIAATPFLSASPVLAQQTVNYDAVFRQALLPAKVAPDIAATLKVDHYATDGNYALVDWVWDEAGGEALFQAQQGHWTLVEKSGGAYESSQLIALGVPENLAVQLVQQLQAQWPEATTDETP